MENTENTVTTLIKLAEDAVKQNRVLQEHSDTYSKNYKPLERKIRENINLILKNNNEDMGSEFKGILWGIPRKSGNIRATIGMKFANTILEHGNTLWCMKLNVNKSFLAAIQNANNLISSLVGEQTEVQGLMSKEQALDINTILYTLMNEIIGEVASLAKMHINCLHIFMHDHIQVTVDRSIRNRAIDAANAIIRQYNKSTLPVLLMDSIISLMEKGIPFSKDLLVGANEFIQNKQKHQVETVQPIKNSFEQGVIRLNTQLHKIEQALNNSQAIITQTFSELRAAYKV
jgi:phage-related tail protein